MTELTLTEKATNRWNEIFTQFISDDKFNKALANPGKHVQSPFNIESKRNGFRLDKDFQYKNGLGFCNYQGAMSGIKMISFMTGQDENTVAHQVHKFLDGHKLDALEIKAEIKQHQEQQKHKDIQKLEFNKKLISDILHQEIDNSYRDKYLKSRGLENVIPLINNKDIISTPELYYDKNTKLPAMLSVVRNEDNKIAFLHRTYLDKDGNKAKVEDVKKVTGATRENAYQRPFYAQVNNPKNLNSKNIHIAEGIETALAVTLLTKNSDKVISAVNAHGLTQYEPQTHTKKVFIWADNDKKGIEAANKLQEKLHGKVRTQIIIPRNKGNDFLDEWNIQKNQKLFKRNRQINKGGLSR